MKFLVAIALLTLAVAEATHVPEHSLRGPRFKVGKLYKYDAEFNMTAGVYGLSSQVSASVLRAQVSIYAKTEREHILKIENVETSGSVKAIDNKYGDIRLVKNRALEDILSIPIKFTMEQGKVVSYTLANRETLESKKIKKSILRSLDMDISETALSKLDSEEFGDVPISYNVTEDTEYGVHTTRYIITSSPYVDFPSEDLVYNVSRIDNFDGERYPGYMVNHNFQKQGCPEVCRKEWADNEYGAGCPVGHEPHQSPIKTTFSHEHALSVVENVLTPEIIRTVEVHVANMYDQDMEVLIRYEMTRTEVSSQSIQEASGQRTYTDLKDMKSEINEEEIDKICFNKETNEAVAAAGNLLKQISEIIVEGDLENSNFIGEKVILLRDVLSKLLQADFKSITDKYIKPLKHLKSASDAEKVARQIWMDILPLVGTQESVKFIVEYISRGVPSGNLLVWEAKEILESLPQNIENPNSETISELRKLTTNPRLLQENYLLHSAVHLTMGRVIGEVCGTVPIVRSPPQQKKWFRDMKQPQDSMHSMHGPVPCPESLVSDIVRDITRKLKESTKPAEIAIYIETLTHIGTEEVLPEIARYVYGTAENIQRFSLRLIDFIKTVAQYALHNVAGKYPEEVLDIVMPVFFNETESPKVRNSAFGVLIRCQPSMDILEKVVIRSWFERSYEVGSFVTSTLETFGNSSSPCMQLLTHRIKTVLPQMRRFDVGLHHAQNYLWSYFDDDRDFGLEGRFEYTPNNESYIPSTMYKSLSYSMDSLKDVVYQFSKNVEGLTQEKILERITDYLNIESVDAIEREEDVFGRDKDDIHTRTVEDLRLTSYTRLFYKSSYYYLDSTIIRSAVEDMAKYLISYFKKTDARYTGYLVKMMLPSSYHTIAIAKTLPYPVEFQMRHPVVLALNIRTTENTRMKPTLKNFELYIRPSVYLSKLFTHQMKNIGDCKEVGVYHEHNVAITYPFEITYDGMTFPNITIKYKIPANSKRILSYKSESGTYAGKEELETLPFAIEKEPIRTNPSPFKFEKNLNIVGVPPFHVELHTEDMNLLNVKLPRSPVEALDLVVRRFLNAGWRYKSINVTILEDEKLWPRDTEAIFKVEYSRQHIPRFTSSMSPQDDQEWSSHMEKESQWQTEDYKWQSQTEDSKWQSQTEDSKWQSQTEDSIWESQTEDYKWQSQTEDYKWQRQDQDHHKAFRQFSDDDENWRKHFKDLEIGSISSFTKNAKSLSRFLNFNLPHISHTFNVSVTAEPLHRAAWFMMEYNHTYDKTLYSVHAEAAAIESEENKKYEISLDHLVGYWNKPDELKYGRDYGKQRAGFLTAINMPKGRLEFPWEQIEIAIKGHLYYESNKNILQDELVDRIDDEHFLPETHDECLRDVREGETLSDDCIKAIREYSIFNKLRMHVLWNEELPYALEQATRMADIYLKHHFFENLYVETQKNPLKGIHIEMDYIDKLVDEPVADFRIKKPSETVTLRRAPVGLPLSSIHTFYESVLLEATNNTYLPTCTLMKNYVKTYDLNTYEFHPKDCHYVLSTHCTEKKNFAVVLRGTKEIYIHVGKNTIVLTPRTGAHYKVKYNGGDREILDPVLFDEQNEIYAYRQMYRNHEHIKVVAKKAGIMVLYDGETVKVQVSPRYKGELCGLCSEFDGEKVREFRGMDRCLYKDHIDFANSNMVKRDGSCRVERLRDERMCDGESNRKVKGKGPDNEGYEPNVSRNVIITKGNEVCFSVLPVNLCRDNDVPRETTYESIGFHCLPLRDITARKMIEEAKFRVLEELARKSIDYVERVEIPKLC